MYESMFKSSKILFVFCIFSSTFAASYFTAMILGATSYELVGSFSFAVFAAITTFLFTANKINDSKVSKP